MSTISKLKLAFQIFEDCGLGDSFPSTEHDEIFGPSIYNEKITEGAKKLLEDLGWFIDEDLGCWKTYV
jgi:hypothetical protein